MQRIWACWTSAERICSAPSVLLACTQRVAMRYHHHSSSDPHGWWRRFLLIVSTRTTSEDVTACKTSRTVTWPLPFAGCALNAWCMRGQFVSCASNTLCIRWIFFNMTFCAPGIRSICALYTCSALATRCAFVVSSLASPKSWQKWDAQRRTDLIFQFLKENWPHKTDQIHVKPHLKNTQITLEYKIFH